MIHKPSSTDKSSSQNQFVPESVSTLPCLTGLVRNILLFVYFFKELVSFIGSLNKCHTSVSKALVFVHLEAFDSNTTSDWLSHTV